MVLKIILAMILCVFAGCGTSSEQRIEMLQATIFEAESVVQDLDLYIVQLEQAVVEAQSILQDPTVDLEQKSEVLKLLTETQKLLNSAKAKQDTLLNSITSWKTRIEELKEQGTGIGTELQMLGESLKVVSTALPPPFNAYGVIGGVILTIVGAVFGKRQERIRADKTVDGIVHSVNVALDTSAESGKLKSILKTNQPPEVRSEVIKSLKRIA